MQAARLRKDIMYRKRVAATRRRFWCFKICVTKRRKTKTKTGTIKSRILVIAQLRVKSGD